MNKSTNKTKKIKLRYVDAKNNFVITLHVSGDSPKILKTISSGKTRTMDEAYKIAVDFVSSYASRNSIKEIDAKSLADYKASTSNILAKKTSKTIAVEVHKDGEFVDTFGHAVKLKSAVKRLVKKYGVSKAKEFWREGEAIILEIEESDKKTEQVKYAANRKIAEAIMEARALGVHMEADQEVEDIIEQLSAQKARQRISNRKITGKYILGELTWDADTDGHMPPEISKFLRENPDKTIEDLLVK